MAIYNGNTKVGLSGISKVYYGTQLVYQKDQPQPAWNTIYSGSYDFEKSTTTQTWNLNTLVNTPNAKFRINFSYYEEGQYGGRNTYTWYGYREDLPVKVTLGSSTPSTSGYYGIVAAYSFECAPYGSGGIVFEIGGSGGGYTETARLSIDLNNKRIIQEVSGRMRYGNGAFRINKIEQYY